MEKKTIILEIPCEIIDKIDSLNTTGDRSTFISNLLEQQIKESRQNGLDANTEFKTTMSDERPSSLSGIVDIVSSNGDSLGKFDINTLEGFESLTKRIEEISEDPAVQIRARSLI